MYERDLQRVLKRISYTLERDNLVKTTIDYLRNTLQTDRVILYYFYRRWQGQVTFESLVDSRFSVLGSTGPDDCFNQEYAALYEAGRVKATSDIETEPITDCHREFLKSLKIKANLVVPILNSQGLWGLLIAHHCQSPRQWTSSDIEEMQKAANILAQSTSINN
jgi:GAF domain-containing protein